MMDMRENLEQKPQDWGVPSQAEGRGKQLASGALSVQRVSVIPELITITWQLLKRANPGLQGLGSPQQDVRGGAQESVCQPS